jgi:preprotein translocase subunit SecE
MARRKKTQTARELDPTRWAHAVFAVLGFIGAWVLTNFIEDGWAILWSYWPQLTRPDRVVANGAGIALALVLTIAAWRRESWFQFVTEVVVEVSQVTWPSRAETRAATVVVIVMTIICSAILFGMDSMWSAFTDLLYDI